MRSALADTQWDTLIRRLQSERCTPFLGAGASAPYMPLGGEVAQQWTEGKGYPFANRDDLPGVAQWMAVKAEDHLRPKQQIQADMQARAIPDFEAPGQPHAVLAKLPIPIYITTNYDDFMAEALRRNAALRRDPQVKVALWNESDFIDDDLRLTRKDGPFTPASPLVFHLHGHVSSTESMVISEDDYVDFLVALGRARDRVLPGIVQRAFTGTSLLFVGYQLRDWNFRVIHRALLADRPQSQTPLNVTVQLEPKQADVTEYLTSYYKRMDVSVYWGTARDFCAELGERWDRASR